MKRWIESKTKLLQICFKKNPLAGLIIYMFVTQPAFSIATLALAE